MLGSLKNIPKHTTRNAEFIKNKNKKTRQMRMSFKLCDCAHKKVKEISRGTNGKEIGKQKLK